MPNTTSYINTTSVVEGSSPGFTFNTTGQNEVGYTAPGFGGFWACTGLENNGTALIYAEFDGIAPTAGTCEPITFVKDLSR